MTNLATNLAVCGLHRLGQPLNSRLTRLGATYVKTCKSSAEYKMYVIPGKEGKPAKPGMLLVTGKSGEAIEIEIWSIEVEKLGYFMLEVPPPLAIGTVRLQNGENCLGFIAEGWIASEPSYEDITHLGSWLNYKPGC